MSTTTHARPRAARRAAVAVAVAAAAVAGAFVSTPAGAEDNGPAGVPGKSCAVVNSDGTVSQVPVGTRVGLLYCGRDGDWHVGWLVDELQQPPKPKPPRAGTLATKATTLAAR